MTPSTTNNTWIYKMQRLWAYLLFLAYKVDCKMHLLFNKVNPIVYFLRIPKIKESLLRKRGIVDMVAEADEAYMRPDAGLAIIFAGGFMHGLLFLLNWATFNYICGILAIEIYISLYGFIAMGAIAIILNELFVFKGDKELVYFDEFDSLEKRDQSKWVVRCMLLLLGSICYIAGSFIFLAYRT